MTRNSWGKCLVERDYALLKNSRSIAAAVSVWRTTTRFSFGDNESRLSVHAWWGESTTTEMPAMSSTPIRSERKSRIPSACSTCTATRRSGAPPDRAAGWPILDP